MFDRPSSCNEAVFDNPQSRSQQLFRCLLDHATYTLSPIDLIISVHNGLAKGVILTRVRPQLMLTVPHSVSVAPECIQAFNELKLGKSTKWIIYKISDDWKEIVVEETSTDPDYSKFREKLLNAKSKNKRGEEGMGGRYAVFDMEYDSPGGEGKRSKITFISWVPDDSPQYPRMMYSSSKESLKRALNGLAADIQANDPDDIEHDTKLDCSSSSIPDPISLPLLSTILVSSALYLKAVNMPWVKSDIGVVPNSPQLSHLSNTRDFISRTLLEQIDERQARYQRNRHQDHQLENDALIYHSGRCASIKSRNAPSLAKPYQEGHSSESLLLSRDRDTRGGVAELPRIGDRLWPMIELDLVDGNTRCERKPKARVSRTDRRPARYHRRPRAGLLQRPAPTPPSPRYDSALPSPARQQSSLAVQDLCSRPPRQLHQLVPLHSISAEAASRKYTFDAPRSLRTRSHEAGQDSHKSPPSRPQAPTSSFQVLNRRPLTRASPPQIVPGPLPPHYRWPLLDSPPQIEDVDFSFTCQRRSSCRTHASTTTASTWTKFTRDPVSGAGLDTAAPSPCVQPLELGVVNTLMCRFWSSRIYLIRLCRLGFFFSFLDEQGTLVHEGVFYVNCVCRDTTTSYQRERRRNKPLELVRKVSNGHSDSNNDKRKDAAAAGK
nr:cofilin [Quercus suber]